nr:hypothetical protein Iba_scaffold14824CG0030 [Ipomoea batatas]
MDDIDDVGGLRWRLSRVSEQLDLYNPSQLSSVTGWTDRWQWLRLRMPPIFRCPAHRKG